jgi:hypothetical protein
MALSLVAFSTAALADVPGLISYQGTLTDEDGVALDTTISITFSIYTDSTGGSLIWSETQPAVVVSQGMFNVLLGHVNAISDTVFSGSSRWFGVQVGDDLEMLPRERIVSVGYAFRTAKADTADYTRVALTESDGDWTMDGDDVYREAGNVGIGTASPSAKLDVRGTLNIGIDGAGQAVSCYGDSSGGKLFWDGSKMALRAGRDDDGTHWAADSVGRYSVAIGFNSKASGPYSTAMGYWANASGFASTAMGYATTASAISATALGYLTTASGEHSTAMGFETSATHEYATAMGNWTVASNRRSTAMGLWTTASGPWSTAMGYATIASDHAATAMGYMTTASGNYSTAIGRYVTASDTGSIVLGSGIGFGNCLVNDKPYSLMVGFNDTTATLFVGGDDHRVGIRTAAPGRVFEIAQGGGSARADGWDVYSSREYKKDIIILQPSDYEEVLRRLSELDVVRYHYKADDECRKLRMGVVAEDAPEEILGEDGKSVSMSDSMGFLLAAVKALMAENEELKTRMAVLEGEK